MELTLEDLQVGDVVKIDSSDERNLHLKGYFNRELTVSEVRVDTVGFAEMIIGLFPWRLVKVEQAPAPDVNPWWER